jgi:glucose/arabinose dehydrogenase
VRRETALAIPALLLLLLAPAQVPARAAPALADRLPGLKLPEGFRIAIYTDEVPNARSMTLGEKGMLFVGSRRAGKVYAVRDADGDGRAESVRVLAEGLRSPNGVAFRKGALYVAEISRILRYDGIEDRLDDPPEPAIVRDDLPRDRHHGWKFIAFGPDGKLYVPVGAPGNIVLREDDERYASILRMDPDGSNVEVFAHGVRNTVGFAWHPKTNELWFTDNGRDWMGDDSPADELNRAPKAGLHFGFPFVHGRDTPDPDYGKETDRKDFVPPARELGPHVAALGMRFYGGEMFPEAWRGRIFIAEHGSWNRSVPIGYRVMSVRLEGNRAVSYEVFAEGWLRGRRPWGRPVDVEVLPDGSMLVSDDHAGAIYRITYEAPKPSR